MDKTLRYTHEQFSANQQKYYQSRAEWMAYCIQIGFATKEEIPKLEKLWDYFKHPDSLPPPVAEERTEVNQFLHDIAHDFDCDQDAHKYGTMCRACQARKLISQFNITLPE